MWQLPGFRSFFGVGSWEKDNENGANMTSLRSFLFRDDFSKYATENYRKLESLRGTSFLSAVKKLPFNAFAKQPWLSLKEQSLPRLLSN